MSQTIKNVVNGIEGLTQERKNQISQFFAQADVNASGVWERFKELEAVSDEKEPWKNVGLEQREYRTVKNAFRRGQYGVGSPCQSTN